MTEARGRVLVVMNRFQGYETKVPEMLRSIGFEAAWSDARPSNSFIVKALTRSGLMQRIRRLSRSNTNRIVSDAWAFGADTILLISPENLRGAEIASLRAALPNARLVLYFWDSAANRVLEQSMIDLADIAYSFDMDDCAAYRNLNHVPLPHQQKAFTQPTSSIETFEYDFCFIGTTRLRRIKLLADIERKFEGNGSKVFFYLFAPSLLQYLVFSLLVLWSGYRGVLSRKSMPFEIYLDTLARSACVLDIEQTKQGGLTMRTMDAVFAGRPLATTNTNILRHDFYDHFPVRVFSASTIDIEVPKPRDSARAEEMFHKYHIGTWLDTIISGRRVSYRRAIGATVPAIARPSGPT